MHRTIAFLFGLAAAPAVAADLPPAARAGAALDERLYLVAAEPAADDLALLAARITCVAYHRDRIMGLLDAGLIARGWNAEVDRLWRLSEALDRFETAHIRPHVDPETQKEVGELYSGSGVNAAARCTGFGNSYALRAVSG